MGSVVEYLAQHEPGGMARRPPGLRRRAQLAGTAPGVRTVPPPRRARRLARPPIQPADDRGRQEGPQRQPLLARLQRRGADFPDRGARPRRGPAAGPDESPGLAPGAVRRPAPDPRSTPSRLRDFDRFRQRALAWPRPRPPVRPWTSAASRRACAIATAATCSASPPWSPGGWSRPASGS